MNVQCPRVHVDVEAIGLDLTTSWRVHTCARRKRERRPLVLERAAQHSTAQHGTGQDRTGQGPGYSKCTPFRAPMRAWSKNCVMLQKEGRKEERGKKQYMKKEEGRKEW